MKTILLKFSGPMQSWGSSSHFESRHTDLYPSKSAVIGLVSAAFGYRRDEDENIKKLNQLHFAVRIDQPGNMTKDYQTAHQYKKKTEPPVLDRTYVTQRYFLEDAVFVAAIGHEDDAWMNRIGEALLHPYFQLFMGRRSYPVPDDYFMGFRNVDVISALKQEPWHAASWYENKNRKEQLLSLPVCADADLIQESSDTYRRDSVESFSWMGRKYLLRQESKTFVKVSNPYFRNDSTEHDAFAWLEE